MAKIVSEQRPLDSLRPHPRNYNLHSESQIEALASAMRVVAFTAPIICKPDGTILGGHARRLALMKLRADSYPEPEGVDTGWLVPCRVVECCVPEELKILATDNVPADQIETDQQALAALLSELQTTDSLDGTWWDAEALDELIGQLAGGEQGGGGLLPDADPDEIPDDAPTRCKPGDLWLLGEHRVLCGDSTNPEDVARLMGGADTECCIYDPPWDSELPPIGWSGALLAFTDGRRVPDVISMYGAPAWVFTWDCVSSWYTPNRPLQRAKYCFWYGELEQYQFDGAHYGDPGEPRTVTNTRGTYEFIPDERGKHLADVFQAPITKLHSSGEHPHEKPVKWVELLIGCCSLGNIYDPFLGSGTTLIAAESLGRRCYGMEISPRYCDVILARWEKATGRQAVLCKP